MPFSHEHYRDDVHPAPERPAETPAKVATFTAGPALRDGGIPIYSIVYERDGVEAGRGLARGDQLEDWRTDLARAGWNVRIVEPDPPGETLAESPPDA